MKRVKLPNLTLSHQNNIGDPDLMNLNEFFIINENLRVTELIEATGEMSKGQDDDGTENDDKKKK